MLRIAFTSARKWINILIKYAPIFIAILPCDFWMVTRGCQWKLYGELWSWERESGNNKDTSGLPTSRPFSSIVCLMAVMKCVFTQYDACTTMIFFDHSRVIMVVADGLVPIWHQDICNYLDDTGWSVHLGNPNLNVGTCDLEVLHEHVYFLLYPPHNEVVGGILVSLRPSVCPSVCPASRVRSVTPTVLVGSISYLYILSSNFRCVPCKISCKISKFEFLAIF